VVWTAVGVVAVVGLSAGSGYLYLRASLPRLDGTVALQGLTAPTRVERDADGLATITGTDRADIARALGYLHGQERYFQMDLLRRNAAGELAGLVGEAALPTDRRNRLHLFRQRARDTLAALAAEERAVLEAYTAGVNQGYAALGADPFEYAVLRTDPAPWSPEDTLLAVWAMYFDLQDSRAANELGLEKAIAALGPDWAAFLYPEGTGWDAPLDGLMLPTPDMPADPPPAPAGRTAGLPDLGNEAAPGSNNWAVGGALTDHGGAIVADDMHLSLGVPNIWYRVRMVLTAADGSVINDVTGVTLPGTPAMIAGSNGRIAWGYTNSYIDTGDAVALEPGAAEGTYRTPDGDRPIDRTTERICASNGTCEDLVVENTVWGPIVGNDLAGRRIAYRWVAHDPGAIRLATLLDMERAGSVAEAVAIAHQGGIPNQNLVVGDRDGNIAWTIMGRVPKRFGTDGRLPESWADGTKGWDGWLDTAEVPVVMNPDSHRLWTANSRVVGGDAYAKLGAGGYAHGARARQIRDNLFARDQFDERDVLAIGLDDRGLVLDRWQGALLAALDGAGDAYEAWIPYVQDWGGRAVPGSVGYRLVRQFRMEVFRLVYESYLRIEDGKRPDWRIQTNQADEPVWRLVSERPANLVPPGFASWDALIREALTRVMVDVKVQTGGYLRNYVWGGRNRPAVRHPLSPFVPGLALLTDPADEPLPGDVNQPRVQARGFGASQRMAVSPGREAQGLFHMPGGQSGHPLSPYYLNGHDDWREGRPTPFLPGPARWTLTFTPG